jgi:hypothetical protein
MLVRVEDARHVGSQWILSICVGPLMSYPIWPGRLTFQAAATQHGSYYNRGAPLTLAADHS